FAAPRVFQDDTAEDKKAIQSVLTQVMMYPLSEYDGTMKSYDWSNIPKVAAAVSGEAETKWVFPEKFFDELPDVLADAPPLPGEEARYAQIRAVLDAMKSNPALKPAMIKAAQEVEDQIVTPLLQFRNYGNSFHTIGAQYRTKLPSAPTTSHALRWPNLTSSLIPRTRRNTTTFPKEQTPPVNGFWSLTLYNEHHFFAKNDLKRYSLGTKNRDLKYNADGSLTIYVQADPPADILRTNWLPAPKDADFSLYVRAYWPKTALLDVQ